jgi:hypothetical protein
MPQWLVAILQVKRDSRIDSRAPLGMFATVVEHQTLRMKTAVTFIVNPFN